VARQFGGMDISMIKRHETQLEDAESGAEKDV